MNWLINVMGSLFIHFLFVLLLSLSPSPTLIQVQPAPYTITLMPISLPETEIQQPPIDAPPLKEEKIKPLEKAKLIEKPKKDDIVEKVKKKVKDPESLDRLHEALEEIRKKAALDEIQKRIAKREEKPAPVPSPPPSPPSPVISSTPSPPTPSPVPPPAPLRQSKLNEYYGLIWAKIKSSWTIPDHLLREGVDLETIIIIIIDKNGRLQRSWFEKRSGNTLYDQMAMRAILKAEPLPSIPKELDQDSLEIGIRFIPD